MCYFLYGGINEDINKNEFNAIQSDFHFKLATIEEVKVAMRKDDYDFRITRAYCDCDTGIGTSRTGRHDVKELATYIEQLRNAHNAKKLYLAKKWASDSITDYQSVHYDDIKMVDFFAHCQENCLYTIHLYKKYY